MSTIFQFKKERKRKKRERENKERGEKKECPQGDCPMSGASVAMAGMFLREESIQNTHLFSAVCRSSSGEWQKLAKNPSQ